MKAISISTVALSVSLLLGTTALAQAPNQSQIDAHMTAARTAAGSEHRNTFFNLCPITPPGAGRGGPAAGGRGAAPAGGRGVQPAGGPDRAGWYAPPFKIFDNLYWLGSRQFSSWALTTSAGIIIIDTNFAYTTQAEIIDGMTKLGLNPKDIKYVIISHAHGDHDQGAADLQKLSGAQVVMGEKDWDMTLARKDAATPYAGGIPTKGISVGPAGHKLTLGDTTIDILLTPGHTDGTLSYIFPVKNGGQNIMAAYSGGTLTGAFGTNGARWDEYIASQKKIQAAAAAAKAQVILSNHSEYDGAYTKARLISSPRQAGENHPFIVGENVVQRYFAVMQECAAAAKLRNGAQ
jgi:metallo-beta-lactamase class B